MNKFKGHPYFKRNARNCTVADLKAETARMKREKTLMHWKKISPSGFTRNIHNGIVRKTEEGR